MTTQETTHTLVHVAAADGFEFVMIVGTFAQCEELRTTWAAIAANTLEPGEFEIRETAVAK